MEVETKPCVICDVGLESAIGDWDDYQPYKGCEIQIIGAYGSTKFDKHLSNTVFRGVICDECAAKLVDKMEEQPGIGRF